jgi:hypothetical protein
MNKNIHIKILEHLNQLNDGEFHNIEELFGTDTDKLSYRFNEKFKNVISDLFQQKYLEQKTTSVYETISKKLDYSPIMARITISGSDYFKKNNTTKQPTQIRIIKNDVEFSTLQKYHLELDKIVSRLKQEESYSFPIINNLIEAEEDTIRNLIRILKEASFLETRKSGNTGLGARLKAKGRALESNHFTSQYEFQLNSIKKIEYKEQQKDKLSALQISRLEKDLDNMATKVKFWQSSSEKNEKQVEKLTIELKGLKERLENQSENTKKQVEFWETSTKRNKFQIKILYGFTILHILFAISYTLLSHFNII